MCLANQETCMYTCDGPFTSGRFKDVCAHGWNTPHLLNEKDVNFIQHLFNCGIITTEQRIEKYVPRQK